MIIWWYKKYLKVALSFYYKKLYYVLMLFSFQNKTCTNTTGLASKYNSNQNSAVFNSLFSMLLFDLTCKWLNVQFSNSYY